MDTPLPQTQLNCSQCGGELHPDEGQIFLACPYCGSAVYLDRAQVVFHWYVAPTLDDARARGQLARWMTSSQTVKDLDRKSRVTEGSFAYFPVWYFKHKVAGGQELVQIVPAAATTISELRSLRLPAGDLRRFTDEIDAQAHRPTIPLATARQWAANLNAPAGLPAPAQAADARADALKNAAVPQATEQSLVHIPLYTYKYTYGGRSYTAIVEGATGGVFANLFPAKSEAPFMIVGVLTALVYLCLALIPIGGFFIDDGASAGIGVMVCAAGGLVAAPILFGLAAWVAAKV